VHRPTQKILTTFSRSKEIMGGVIQKVLPKKYLLPLALFLGSTLAEASYAKLAKDAGMSYKTMTEIVKKVIKHESTTGNYRARNKKTGAYGRYQIMPRTAKAYTKKLKIPHSKWKAPRNQDKIFQAILGDNIRNLKKHKIKISAFSIYGAHQQGVGGLNAILKNKKLTKRLEKNLRYNLPKKLRLTSASNLRRTWLAYWKKKMK